MTEKDALFLICEAWLHNRYLPGCGEDISETALGTRCSAGSVFKVAADRIHIETKQLYCFSLFSVLTKFT